MKVEDVRAWARNVRRAMSEDVRKQKNEKISNHLGRHPLMDQVASIMVYSAIHQEVDVAAWVRDCWARGVTVAYPRTLPQDKQLEPRVVSRHGDLVPGTWGILEPASTAPLLPPEQLDGVIVPGLAFDHFGFRVGYGGGYYDRFLPRLRPGALTIGVVYQELLVDHLAPAKWDVPVDWVVTDEGLLHAASVREGRTERK